MSDEGMPSTEMLTSTLNAYFAAIASIDPARIAALFAADCQLEDPIGSGTQQGRSGVEAYFARGIASVASHVEIQTIVALPSGDRIAAHWKMRARGKAGQDGQAEGIDVLRLNGEGQIVRAEGYWNAKAFRQALTSK